MTRIEPIRGTFSLHLSHPLFPSGVFAMDFPETYGASRMPLYLGSWREKDLTWKPLGKGAFEQKVNEAGSHSYTVRIEPTEDGALLSVTFANLGPLDLMGLYVNPCIMTAGVPGLPDPDCIRTFVWLMNGIKSLSETRRCLQPDTLGHRQNYFMSFARRGDSGGFQRAGWGNSPDLIRVPLAAKVAEDSNRVVGTIWRNASTVAYNWSDTHHCMHSIPYFGFLNAGEEKTIEGRIYFLEGGIAALTEGVKEHFPSLFYEDPIPPDPNWVIDE